MIIIFYENLFNGIEFQINLKLLFFIFLMIYSSFKEYLKETKKQQQQISLFKRKIILFIQYIIAFGYLFY